MKYLLVALSLLVSISVFADRVDSKLNAALNQTPQTTVPFATNNRTLPLIEERQLEQNYLKHFFAPWDKPFMLLSLREILQQQQEDNARFEQKPGWGENHYKHSREWVDNLIINMNLSEFPNRKQSAITVNDTDLRILPTDKPSFNNPKKPGEGYPFDNLQNSRLYANIPVHVMQRSRDGAWSMVVTPYRTIGWVRSKDIARVSYTFIQRWRSRPLATTIKDDVSVRDKLKRFYFKTNIGQLLPLVKRYKTFSEVWVAARNSYGRAVLRRARVRNNAIAPWPLAATETNVAHLANEILGQPYGWGGLYDYRDCSALMKDLFTAFAIWLPRNSSDQIKMGKIISLSGMNPANKQRTIAKQAQPFFTLIHAPGHIGLYLGNRDDRDYIYNAIWGLRTGEKGTQSEGRDVIGKTVVMPLDLGIQQPDVTTLLQRIDAITVILPEFTEQNHPAQDSNVPAQ